MEQTAFDNWCFQETVEMEHKKQIIKKACEDLTRQQKLLEQERKDFLRKKEMEERRIEQEHHLFEMKWKILEEEMRKLADEKLQIKKQRAFFKRVEEYEESMQEDNAQEDFEKEMSSLIGDDMFFVGVKDFSSLKKRYKDLIKIYHPDNVAGDTEALQEINREYEALQQRFRA